jgi:very-short-patch-repair endonuclease
VETIHYIIIGGIAILLIAGFLISVLGRSRPYLGVKRPFTKCEAKFLRVLDRACSENNLNLRVMGKIRLADFVVINPKLKGKNFWKHFSKISQKHVDFCLLSKDSLKLLAVIELDDSSHLNKTKEDLFKNKVFEDIGLPLIRIVPTNHYDVEDIVNEIKQGLSIH